MHLKKLSSTCQFGTFLNDALRDRLVCGLRNSSIQRKLLAETQMSFEEACENARSMELASQQSQLLQNSEQSVSESAEVKFVKAKVSEDRRMKTAVKPNYNSKKEQQTKECWRCGRKHNPHTCPAKDWKCFVCGSQGHTSKKCRQRQHKKREIKALDESESEDSEEEFLGLVEEQISKISKVKSSSSQAVTCGVRVENKIINFEIDSGASVSVLSEVDYKSNFSVLKIKPFHNSLKSVSGNKIKAEGV